VAAGWKQEKKVKVGEAGHHHHHHRQSHPQLPQALDHHHYHHHHHHHGHPIFDRPLGLVVGHAP